MYKKMNKTGVLSHLVYSMHKFKKKQEKLPNYVNPILTIQVIIMKRASISFEVLNTTDLYITHMSLC